MENKTLPIKKHANKAVKGKQPKEDVSDEHLGLLETEKLDTEIPPYSTKVEVGEEDSSETGDEDLDNLSREHKDDPEWVPGSLHLQRKLQNDNETEGATYYLRSRLVGK